MVKHCKSCGDVLRGRQRLYCGQRCTMYAYHITAQGKAVIIRSNAKHRRPEKEYTCFICNKAFVSTRKRAFCDEHNTPDNYTKKYRIDKKGGK